MAILDHWQPSGSAAAAVNNPAVCALLGDLGATGLAENGGAGDHPVARWADSGLMYLVGDRETSPLFCPVPLASCADAGLDAFRALAGVEVLPGTRGAELLCERAAITGHRADGAASPGGSCRLLPTADGCVGLSLARPGDWELVPAWLESDRLADWDDVRDCLAGRDTDGLVARGRLLGLAVTDATVIPEKKTPWFQTSCRGVPAPANGSAPRVLDLSSLWAGPLCSHLWQQAGAEVTKIESALRPDGARAGQPEFFELLNGGKRCLSLELHTRKGQRELRDLIAGADIVLEGSRPRALRQMGIVAEELLEEHPGLSWVSITGYGRREPQGNWIAYGDDAGVAAGLSAILHQVSGRWLICGDAIADPLTGLHAALAGWASWQAGGGRLVELALEQTVRHCITASAPPGNDYRERQAQWVHCLRDRHIPPRFPRRRGGQIPSTP